MHRPDDVPTHRFCVAPMLDRTDRHCRALFRQLSRHTRLYTEMLTTGALLHGDTDRHLGFDSLEHPLAVQLGGSDPHELAACARLAEQRGYDEINLNCGCPSDRVQSGRFGACLMLDPGLVAACVAAMVDAVAIPVTVKCRIGVDDQDGYEVLAGFVDTVAAAGCDTFVVHARKAWLKGLSPKENREIPPLDYPAVYRLKAEFPHLRIVLNGGIQDLASARLHLQHVDGVMLGRAAYHNPELLTEVDGALFGVARESREIVAQRLRARLVDTLASGIPLHRVTRHLLGLYQGRPGARNFRRHLSTCANQRAAGIEVWDTALAYLHGNDACLPDHDDSAPAATPRETTA
ncbi:MAG: tRNA dihydrouridine(20/20a) synthase DusA [Porticoccaceae bacterium]